LKRRTQFFSPKEGFEIQGRDIREIESFPIDVDDVDSDFDPIFNGEKVVVKVKRKPGRFRLVPAIAVLVFDCQCPMHKRLVCAFAVRRRSLEAFRREQIGTEYGYLGLSCSHCDF